MSRAIVRGVVALVLILGGGELIVRAFITGPSPQVYDPEIGYSYLPNKELFQAKEGYARFKFNALGLNDAEIGANDDRCRVLVVGDSYTTSLQVPREQNFTSVAEQLNPGLDVVNAGRDGLFLGDVHKVVRRLVPNLHPDLVVYVFSEGDVDDDTQLADFHIVVDPISGAIVDAVMNVEAKEGFKEAFGPILHRSALATRLASQLQPSAATAAGLFQTWRSWFDGGTRSEPPSRVAPARPPTQDILTFVFKRLGDTAPTALLYINALHYGAHDQASVAQTSIDAEAVAREAASRAGLTFSDAGDQLIGAVAQTGQPPFGFDNGVRPGGHLNAIGHQAVARALVDLVQEVRSSQRIECGAK
jgi:lysophospholipase L1-like esterase